MLFLQMCFAQVIGLCTWECVLDKIALIKLIVMKNIINTVVHILKHKVADQAYKQTCKGIV